LKDHAGIGPVKMSIKSDQANYAVLHGSSFGLTFGRSYDLRVESNANSNTSSYCNVGSPYPLPSNTTNPHFFTGSKYFTVSEYEVFLV